MSNLYLRAICGTLAGAVVFFAAIFLPAWTLDYWQGWAFFLTLMISTTLVTIYIAVYDKPLLASRLRMGPSVEKTAVQKIITSMGLVVFVAMFAIMPLDHRFAWSPAVPAYLSILGNVVAALGILIYFIVVKENRFAAATVDVVEGQSVVSTGPYAIVRHPMYTGAILVFLGAPVALGSWWGFLFMPIVIGGFAWRLLDEEKYLRKNLPGYAEYIRAVRYRLAPYILVTERGRLRSRPGGRNPTLDTHPTEPAWRHRMAVKRIVANVAAKQIDAAKAFYGDALGMAVVMDLGWIMTFAAEDTMVPQISVATEGGSGTPVPDISIEVDDLAEVHGKMRAGGFRIAYGPVTDLGA